MNTPHIIIPSGYLVPENKSRTNYSGVITIRDRVFTFRFENVEHKENERRNVTSFSRSTISTVRIFKMFTLIQIFTTLDIQPTYM